MEYEQIRYDVIDGLLTITLNRPERLNAFTLRMSQELVDAFDRANVDDEVRAVVLTGAGRGFCAGMDLGQGTGVFDAPDGVTHRDEGGLVSLAIFDSLKPVIVAFNGPAVGVGVTMTLPADVRLASTAGRFGLVFTRRGLVPEAASSWFLPRVVGVSRALEWVSTGRVFGAGEALAGGLVRSVHEPEDLLPAAHALAREIADNTASVSVALSRQMLWRMLATDHPMAAHELDSRIMRDRGLSLDAREGVASFLEKRPAHFPDRVSADLPEYFPWWPSRPFRPLTTASDGAPEALTLDNAVDSRVGSTDGARAGTPTRSLVRSGPEVATPADSGPGAEHGWKELELGARPTCIVGVGESSYYKHGKSPVTEFALTCVAVLAAAKDAGLDPRDLDGFASYAADRNEGVRLAAALGVREMNFSNIVWGGGGGGCAAAVGNAMAAVSAGLAKYVVVYRGLAQGQFERYGVTGDTGARALRMVNWRPYGMAAPVHSVALKFRRFMHLHGTSQDALAAISLTSYEHAQRNPRAMMYGRPLTREQYDASRWIAEPFHLYDCCQENDGAAAVIVTTAERARDLSATPAYIAAAAQGNQPRPVGADGEDQYFASSNLRPVAERLFAQAGMTAADIDVAQVYENFTGGVVMALVDGGFCAADEVNEFITEKNLSWSGGKLPLNTSGGNLAEAYIHGLELVNEAVRQIRGESTCQVPDVQTSLVIGGPTDAPISSLILTREA